MLALFPATVSAAASQVQKNSGQHSNGSPSATFGSTPTEDNLLIAVCGSAGGNTDTTISGPVGWSTAVESGQNTRSPIGIYYKIASSSESATVGCSDSTSSRAAISIFEYSGMETASVLDRTASSNTTSNTNSQSTGTTAATTQADELIIAGVQLHNTATYSNSWTNSFTQESIVDTRQSTASRIVSSTGTYETTESWTGFSRRASGAMATFKVLASTPAYDQAAYRLFANNNSTDVGAALASQDTAATLTSAGEAFRLRYVMHNSGAGALSAGGAQFKLQFSPKIGTCDLAFTGESYTDVTTKTAIAYNDNATPTDGSALTANANDPTHSGHTMRNQTYEELNNFTSTSSIGSGEDGKWDFALKDNAAPAGSSYCLRVVLSTGVLLDNYGVIIEVTTSGTFANPDAGDAVVIYGESGNTQAMWRHFDGSANTFGGAMPAPTSATPQATALRTSPKKLEAIAGHVDSSGNLNILCYNGVSWLNEWSVSVGGTGDMRRFDIAYETNTGDVIVLYSTNSATTNELAYRTKDGASVCGSANWSAATNLDPIRTSGVVHWVKLAANTISSSNLIAASWADANSDLSAQIWSGSAWGNEPSAALATSLELVGAAQDMESFDLVYESLSGDLMIAWGLLGAGTANLIKYVACTGGTSACTWGSVTSVPTVADTATTIDLAANPDTNEISLAAVDNGTLDVSGGYWTGSAWSGYANLELSAEAPAAGEKTISTSWLVNGAATRWIINFDDDSGTGIQWFLASPGATPTLQTAVSVTPDINNDRSFYAVDNDPYDDSRAMWIMVDSTGAAFAKRTVMNSSGVVTWSEADGSTALGTLAKAKTGDIAFAYWRFIASNTVPAIPSSLAQKKTDDTAVVTAGWINSTTVKFTATASDPDSSDTLQLCVESDLLQTAFSGTEDSCGTGVAYSGTDVTVSVTISGLSDLGEYHWRARIKDAGGLYSFWVSYGGNTEDDRDFGIDTTAPTLVISETISQVQKTSEYNANGTVIVSLSSTPVQGNVLIAVVGGHGGGSPHTIGTPVGWTKAVESPSGQNERMTSAIFYKLAGASESTDHTFSLDTTDRITATVFEYDGLAASNVLDQVSFASTTSNVSFQSTGTTGTTTQANELLIAGISTHNTVGTDFDNDWTNSFTKESSVDNRMTSASRIVNSTGAYETTESWETSGGTDRFASGVIATFRSGMTGGVFDGTATSVDANFNDSSLSALSANWSGINADVSGLNKYEYSIGTSAGATDIKAWTDNGTNTTITATGLTLQTSKRYFYNIRATDNAGNSAVFSSNGQLVAPTISFSVSPSSVTFDNLNDGNSFTDTQATTLTTSTNAYGGYIIRAFATDLLRSSANQTLGGFSGGTYASPDSWQPGDTGLGYTSSDTSIQGVNIFQASTCPGGSALVAPGCYAPFSSVKPGDIVADHVSAVSGTPISNEEFTITYRVTAAADQAANSYSTSVVYAITPIY